MNRQLLIDGKTAMDRLDSMIDEIIPFTKSETGSMNTGTVNGIFKANELLAKMCIEEKIDAIPVEWLKNELIPKAEKLGATDYVNNIKFVLEDWEAWKKYR